MRRVRARSGGRLLAATLTAALLAGCGPRPAFRAPVYPDPVSPVGPMAGPAPARGPGPLTELQDSPDPEAWRARMLEDAASNWLGTPYRHGGTDGRGVDCSALVQSVMDELGVELPRTTWAQRREGRSIERDEARAGDLVFFRIGSRVSHVGVMLGPDRFLHASLSRGVIVTELEEPYFARRLVDLRRVLDN